MKLIILISAFVAGFLNVSNANQPLGEIAPHLFFLGTVEGKSFYAESDSTKLRSWHETKDYCQSLGMRLASVNSLAQLNFLNNAQNDTNFWGWHWTAGRDALLPRQFSWDTTEGEVSSTVVTSLGIDVTPYLNCLTFTPKGSPNNFVVKSCSLTTGFALCET